MRNEVPEIRGVLRKFESAAHAFDSVVGKGVTFG
jgi:hypothetical protein